MLVLLDDVVALVGALGEQSVDPVGTTGAALSLGRRRPGCASPCRASVGHPSRAASDRVSEAHDAQPAATELVHAAVSAAATPSGCFRAMVLRRCVGC